MPWVRLDDRFPSHRKVALLSDRAFRLYVAALCWASENLTEGHIQTRELPVVARVRGVKAAAAELEAAGLWDATATGWVIHDYLLYNPDRAAVKADRAANAARQAAFRERKRAERDAQRAAEEATRNGSRNAVTPDAVDPDDDASATRRRHDDDTTERETDAANSSSSQVTAIRNGVSNGPPSRPLPLLPPTEVVASKPDAALPRIGDRPRIPATAVPLVEQITAAGCVVGWDLAPADWFLIEALIRRCTIPVLVQHALAAAQGARTRPRSATYFLPGWRSLPDVPATFTAPPALPAATSWPAPRSRAQTETDDLFDRAMTRARTRMAQEGS